VPLAAVGHHIFDTMVAQSCPFGATFQSHHKGRRKFSNVFRIRLMHLKIPPPARFPFIFRLILFHKKTP
jgi:hypothetical protein